MLWVRTIARFCLKSLRLWRGEAAYAGEVTSLVRFAAALLVRSLRSKQPFCRLSLHQRSQTFKRFTFYVSLARSAPSLASATSPACLASYLTTAPQAAPAPCAAQQENHIPPAHAGPPSGHPAGHSISGQDCCWLCDKRNRSG